MPVYEVPPPKYAAETVLTILLNPDLDLTKVCCSQPVSVTSSSTFIVDLSKLAHPDDVKTDIFGIWNHSGSHPQCFKVNVKEDGYVSVVKCAPGASGDNVVYMRRLHSTHPSNKDFKRMMAFLSGK